MTWLQNKSLIVSEVDCTIDELARALFHTSYQSNIGKPIVNTLRAVAYMLLEKKVADITLTITKTIQDSMAINAEAYANAMESTAMEWTRAITEKMNESRTALERQISGIVTKATEIIEGTALPMVKAADAIQNGTLSFRDAAAKGVEKSRQEGDVLARAKARLCIQARQVLIGQNTRKVRTH